MFDIRVPKLNSNDGSYVLVEWLRESGSLVRAGEAVALVETSKAMAELHAEADGFLHHVAEAGAEAPVGGLIGYQFATEGERLEFVAAGRSPGTGEAGPTLTRPARVLAERHGIPVEALRRLNLTVVRSEHVRELIAGAAAPRPEPHTAAERQQRAVADVVSSSHRDIPAAFTVVKSYVDRALAALDGAGRREQVVIGLPELLVRCLGLLDTEYPAFFAVSHPGSGGGRAVGVTVDAGTGLFIPVVRAAREQSLASIAETLMGYRKKALTRSFREQDLAGAGDIVLSLNAEPDVVLAQPIVHPGHTCMVSVGGVLDELCLDAGGAVGTRRYVYLGVTYDHRVINGRDAMLFLRRLKDLIEHPDPVVAGGTGRAS